MRSRFILFSVFLLTGISGFSQSRFFLNLNGGCDYNFNKYYSPYDYTKFENSREDFNLGFDAGIRLADWIRFRMEFKFTEYSYGHFFNSSSDLSKAEMTLNNLDFNPMLDFRVLSAGKFEFFLTSGFQLEYVVGDEQETYRTDGQMSSMNYIPMDYDDSMTGWIGGLILKYNLFKNIGLTFTPEYTQFFHKLYEENDGNLQRISTNVGVEWTF